MRGCCFDRARTAVADAAEARCRPVHAIRPDSGSKRWIGGDKKDQATPAAETCEPFACLDAICGAKMAVDDAEAAWELRHDGRWIRRSLRVGQEEGAGKRAAVSRKRWRCEARGGEQFAPDRGLPSGRFQMRERHGRFR